MRHRRGGHSNGQEVGKKLKKTVRTILLIFWVILIFVLTGLPGLETPHLAACPMDKVYHFILFLVLGILGYRTVRTLYFFMLGSFVIALAELQQLAIPGRSFELMDMVAGLIGLCFAYTMFKGYRIVKHAVSKT